MVIKTLLNRSIQLRDGGNRGGAGLRSRGSLDRATPPAGQQTNPVLSSLTTDRAVAETVPALPTETASAVSSNAPGLAAGRCEKPHNRPTQARGRQAPALKTPTTTDEAKYPITEGESLTVAHKYTVFVNYY